MFAGTHFSVLLVLLVAVVGPLLAEVPVGFRIPAVVLEVMFAETHFPVLLVLLVAVAGPLLAELPVGFRIPGGSPRSRVGDHHWSAGAGIGALRRHRGFHVRVRYGRNPLHGRYGT